MELPNLQEIEAACAEIYRQMTPTPAYVWPQLCALAGTEVWIKHENHTPTGAFKCRGGITFMNWLRHAHPECRAVVSATRGNHGQSLARAATMAGLRAIIVVPVGNSADKNAAMRGFGAELVEFGADFDAARGEAERIAHERGAFPVPPFHRELVRGVASYGLELFRAAPDLDRVYVPIGCGSGICGLIAARAALGAKAEIIGVVSARADGARRSFLSGHPVGTDRADTFADGLAVRTPVAEAFAVYAKGASDIVAVEEEAIASAMAALFRTTHNVAEGAGAAALAALLADRDALRGKKVAAVLSGGNVDAGVFAQAITGGTPEA